ISPGKAIVRVDKSILPKIIGRRGETINKIEHELGISIDLMPTISKKYKEVGYEYVEKSKTIEFVIPSQYSGTRVNVYIGRDYLSTVTVGRNGRIKFLKNSELGRMIVRALEEGSDIKLYIED
ncbi:MAG: KH domain-containing protein, partial [Thaumarchaeota archaeon]|nr:KH domain-containing protein [Candidatus Geocrenenecus arthurdayi]